MNRANHPAYPHATNDFYVGGESSRHEIDGMTLREYYAGLAMEGLIQRGFVSEKIMVNGICEKTRGLHGAAVAHADALLAELAKEKP